MSIAHIAAAPRPPANYAATGVGCSTGSVTGTGPQMYADNRGVSSAREPREMMMPIGSCSLISDWRIVSMTTYLQLVGAPGMGNACPSFIWKYIDWTLQLGCQFPCLCMSLYHK